MAQPPENGLAYRLIDTSLLPAKDGEEVWEDLLVPVTSPIRLNKMPVGGRIDSWLGHNSMLCDVQAGAQKTVRSAKQLALGPTPLYNILLVCEGKLRYRDANHDSCLEPGDLIIENVAAKRTMVTSTHRTIQFFLPYNSDAMPLPPNLHGHCLNRRHPATRMLARHILAIRNVINSLSLAELSHYQSIAHTLLSAALPASLRLNAELPRMHSAMRLEITRYINQHIAHPSLNVRQLSQQFRLSRTQLYRLFKEDGGPTAYIRYRKLCWAVAALKENPSASQEDIAVLLNFSSVAAMQRLFQQTFNLPFNALLSINVEGEEFTAEQPLKSLFARLPDIRNK